MNKTLERTIWIIILIIVLAAGFLGGRNDINNTIDSAQATSASLQNALSELLSVTQPPDLSYELTSVMEERLGLATRVAELYATINALETSPTPTPAPLVTLPPVITLSPPTITSTPDLYCFSRSTIEVVAVGISYTNLWYILSDNNDSLIMDIYEDGDGNRIQYSIGTTFFILEDEIEAENGTFFEVVGPLGAGMYVIENTIRLFNDNPDLDYCN